MFIYGLIAVAIIWFFMVVLRRTSPEFLALWSVRLIMIFFIGAAFVFLLRGYILPVIASLIIAELTRRLNFLVDDNSSLTSSLNVSQFKAPLITLEFSHKTGDIEGYLINANTQNILLKDLDKAELIVLYQEFINRDLPSSYLIEAYLNSRFLMWREHLDVNIHPRTRIQPETSAMSEQEAYEIMGLTFEALEADLRRPYRLLMKKFHPDKGGSLWFASRINQARDLVINAIFTRHNSNS